MSEDKNTLQVPEIGNSSRDQTYRHSLQPKGAGDAPPLRHTQSQNYGAKKKRVKVPPIPEVEKEVTVVIVNEQAKEKKQRHSKGSRRSSQASSRLGFDNAGFEVEDGLKITRGTSAASSVRSSTRDPSVQSLAVVREQYCCCTRWTPCERALFAAVCVLSFIVLVLVVVVVLVAVHPADDDDPGAGNGTGFVSSIGVVPNGLRVKEFFSPSLEF